LNTPKKLRVIGGGLLGYPENYKYKWKVFPLPTKEYNKTSKLT
jgi:hypothetical protein